MDKTAAAGRRRLLSELRRRLDDAATTGRTDDIEAIVDELDALFLDVAGTDGGFEGGDSQAMVGLEETIEDGVRSAGLKLADLLDGARKLEVGNEMRTLPLRGLALRLPDVATEVRETIELHKGADDAARSQERFAAHVLGQVSREIRDPLLGIVGALRDLASTDLTFAERDALEGADQNALTMLQLVNDLLDLSRLHSGTFAPEKVDFQLRDCLAAGLAGITARAMDVDAKIVDRVDRDVPDDLVGDPGRLRQVLATLMGNALSAAEGGKVSLSVVVEEEYERAVLLHFRIAADSPAARARRRAMNETGGILWRGGGATGLGLSISRQIVEQLGGRTWVETRSTGGSVLHFTAKVGTRPARKRDPAKMVEFVLRGLPLLVVEIDTIATREVVDALHRLGVRPVVERTVEGARQRLAAAKEAGRPFSHMAICAMLTEQRTTSMVEAAAAMSPEIRPPVLLLTPSGQRGDAARCRRFGISAYLTLPLEERDFHDAAAILSDADTSTAISNGVLVTRHYLREARRFAPVLAVAEAAAEQDALGEQIAGLGHRVITMGFEKAANYVQSKSDPPGVVVALFDNAEQDIHAWLRKLSPATHEGSSAPLAIVAIVDPQLPRARDLRHEAADATLELPLQLDELQQVLGRLSRGRMRRPDSTMSRQNSLIDRRALAARLGDPAMVEVLLNVFLKEGERMSDRIRRAVIDGDDDRLLRRAHAMRSAMATLGVRSAADLCGRLESCARRGDMEQAMMWQRRLDRMVASIRLELVATVVLPA